MYGEPVVEGACMYTRFSFELKTIKLLNFNLLLIAKRHLRGGGLWHVHFTHLGRYS